MPLATLGPEYGGDEFISVLLGRETSSTLRAVSADEGTEGGWVSVVDAATKTVVDTVTLGHPTHRPQVVAVNPLCNTVYVGTTGEAGLTVISCSSNAELSSHR